MGGYVGVSVGGRRRAEGSDGHQTRSELYCLVYLVGGLGPRPLSSTDVFSRKILKCRLFALADLSVLDFRIR